MLQTQDAMNFGLLKSAFASKIANTLGCHFTDVQGPIVTDGDFDDMIYYRGRIYSGTSDTAKSVGIPMDGDGNVVQSIRDDEGIYYAAFGSESAEADGYHGVRGTILFPAVETFVPDLDYRLLGVVVTGKIEGQSRTELA